MIVCVCMQVDVLTPCFCTTLHLSACLCLLCLCVIFIWRNCLHLHVYFCTMLAHMALCMHMVVFVLTTVCTHNRICARLSVHVILCVIVHVVMFVHNACLHADLCLSMLLTTACLHDHFYLRDV